jgi:glyoxylase-like metal-dependent hydrolase (beta-lactamase superfamily II)
MRNPSRVLCASALLGTTLAAQQFPPGYVDPQPVLKAAIRAIGADKLNCVTMSGTGYAGMVGQARLNDKNVDWPRGEPLANYTRTMNWDARVMKEEFERKPGLNPASWKHGVGWRGGTPLQRSSRQTFLVNGTFAWHQDGAAATPVAAPPEDAELWQLDMWLNPHGFLKAAMMPGANPTAAWRWELGEMGRDLPTTVPEKVTVVAIQVMGRYRVDATINQNNLLQRIHTRVPDPVLGDMNYEHEFADESYIDLGNGIRFPTGWHSHVGWDDNYQAQSVNAGHNGFGGTFKEVKANACEPAPGVPESVRNASVAVRVESQKLADGVYLLGGASHNSVAVEFKDYIAVIEAPLDEPRNLAVIEEVVRLIPKKPIRFLVNTHQHHDHIGGLRTYMHIGATIITHWKNWTFYTRDVLNYAPRTLQPDLVSLAPPTELAEGYYYEQVTENYVLSDGTRNMHLHYVQPLRHADGMLIAYLPRERMLIEADLFDTHEPPAGTPTPANTSLNDMVRRLKLDVAQIVPIHGKPVPWSTFAKLMTAQRALPR